MQFLQRTFAATLTFHLFADFYRICCTSAARMQ